MEACSKRQERLFSLLLTPHSETDFGINNDQADMQRSLQGTIGLSPEKTVAPAVRLSVQLPPIELGPLHSFTLAYCCTQEQKQLQSQAEERATALSAELEGSEATAARLQQECSTQADEVRHQLHRQQAATNQVGAAAMSIQRGHL